MLIKLFLFIALVTSACVSQPPQPIDPSGTWTINLSWTPDTCQLSTLESDLTKEIEVVTDSDVTLNGINIDRTLMVNLIDSSITCDAMSCVLTEHETVQQGKSSGTLVLTLTLDAMGSITGSGTFSSQSCSQPVAVAVVGEGN